MARLENCLLNRFEENLMLSSIALRLVAIPNTRTENLKFLSYFLSVFEATLRVIMERVQESKERIKYFQYKYIRARLCMGCTEAFEDFSRFCKNEKHLINNMEDDIPVDGEEDEQKIMSGILFMEEFIKELIPLLHVKTLDLETINCCY